MAIEAKTKAANVLLAPTLNVIRSPLGGFQTGQEDKRWLTVTTGGRNYETYSEDPVVLGTLAAAFINGLIFKATSEIKLM